MGRIGNRKAVAVPTSNASLEAGETMPADDDGDGSVSELRKEDSLARWGLERMSRSGNSKSGSVRVGKNACSWSGSTAIAWIAGWACAVAIGTMRCHALARTVAMARGFAPLLSGKMKRIGTCANGHEGTGRVDGGDEQLKPGKSLIYIQPQHRIYKSMDKGNRVRGT